VTTTYMMTVHVESNSITV